MPLNLKGRAVLWHLMAVVLLRLVAALGADWIFSRTVLGQFDRTLLDLAHTEATAALASPDEPIRVHEMPTGTAPPSFPRLDKFVQIGDLDGHVLARSVNLGTGRLPTPSPLLTQLRAGRPVFETLPDFGEELLMPIDRVVQRARLIGESRLDARLPHPGSQDEIVRLVETLNEMLGRIERGFDAPLSGT